MKMPRLSIFMRILLAALIPLICIFSIVIFIINSIIYEANTEVARERTVLVARQAAVQTESMLENMEELLEITCMHLAVLAKDGKGSFAQALEFIRPLLDSNPHIYTSWLIPEAGFWDETSRQGHIFLRRAGQTATIQAFRAEIMDDPVKAPWYGIPRRTGQPFFHSLDHFDYGIGYGREYVGGLSRPVMVGGEVAAVAGIEILYEQAFRDLADWEAVNGQRVFLVSESGLVLYSSSPDIHNQPINDMALEPGDRRTIYAGLREKQAKRFEGRSPSSGERSLFYLSPLNIRNADRPLFLLTEVPVATLYREADRALEMVLCISILGLLVLGLSVFFATRSMVRSIRKLTQSAEWIANGKLDVVLDDFGGGHEPRHEVDQLENSLKKMLDQLTQAHELRLLAVEAEYECEKLEQASEAKNRFFANMSHEIRTPMNAILGMAELLLNEPLEEKEAKYASDIKLAAESLLNIINDILDLSKLESGKLALLNVHFDLWALLDHLQSLCYFLAGKKGLTFHYERDASVPQYLYGDDSRLRQVLLNIIGNAVKFTESGTVRLLATCDKGMLRFEVTDSGIGIRPEEIEHLFQPFKQLDTTKNRTIRGTGLGLSICYNLVDLMGGSISVDSVYGQGSTFHINVPCVPGDPERLEVRDSQLQARFTADSKALIIDDSLINLDVASGLISLFGIICDTATSGRQAIDMIKANTYDIIFMDHMMPEMDGVETTVRIREMGGRYRDLVIVALTANAVIGTREIFLKAGMNDFLSKPIVKTKLQAILSKWMPESKRAASVKTNIYHRKLVLTGKKAETSIMEPRFHVSPLERARDIPGLDVAAGLNNMAMEEKLYFKVLAMIPETKETLFANLRGQLDADNAKGFAIEIHGAKGALANIGATALSLRAAELEISARDGDLQACIAGLPAFIADFDQLSGRIAALLKPGGTAVKEREPGGREELLSGLEQLLESFRAGRRDDCAKTLQALRALDFGSASNADLAGLESLMARSDPDGVEEYVTIRFMR